ncbi:gag-pol polyprotein [Lasallia pustulata]|uniref:Gag-pol polyprotein n=1 Tax=Lasallia pustulata TaxID=136370 RepID=A0A1W5CXN5_9LECA|nr:gag-pol polyprotein [Lasallia pustulata]
MAMTAIKRYYIEQMDIVTAFLYGPIEEEVYMEQPKGFTNGKDKVCKLNKALYGLKQSPRAWYKTISATLQNPSFECLQSDHGLFLNKKRNTWITLYVDNIHLVGPDKRYIETIKEELASHY